MTAHEFVGRTKQAVKTAKDALDDGEVRACTPEAHKAVVVALKADLDIHDAQAEFFGNGFTDAVAQGVAEKIKERSPLTINGKEIPMPSAATIWRLVIIASVFLSAHMGGCHRDSPVPAPAVKIDPAVLELAKYLAGVESGTATNHP